jgi:proteasome beta subunit
MEKELKTGTTTLGLVCKNSVVMASEHRATMGTLIAHKNTQKVFKIDNHLALTTAGLVGDAQLLARWLMAEAELFNLKRGQEMSVKAAATLMANILSGRRYFPYWVQLLIGGLDSEGGHVYSLDAAGGAIPDNYITTGSGSPYVYGILEDYYKENMTPNDGVDLAIRGVFTAMKRDAASGNGIDVVLIEKKGYQEIPIDKIEQRIKKMGLKN